MPDSDTAAGSCDPPGAGFAAWAFARRGAAPFFGGTAPTGASGVPEGRLTEAPVLACLGYELALSPAVEPSAAQAWAAAVRRLSGRDPWPALAWLARFAPARRGLADELARSRDPAAFARLTAMCHKGDLAGVSGLA